MEVPQPGATPGAGRLAGGACLLGRLDPDQVQPEALKLAGQGHGLAGSMQHQDQVDGGGLDQGIQQFGASHTPDHTGGVYQQGPAAGLPRQCRHSGGQGQAEAGGIQGAEGLQRAQRPGPLQPIAETHRARHAEGRGAWIGGETGGPPALGGERRRQPRRQGGLAAAGRAKEQHPPIPIQQPLAEQGRLAGKGLGGVGSGGIGSGHAGIIVEPAGAWHIAGQS